MRSTIEALNKDWRELRQMSVDLTTEDVVARFLSLTRSADMLSKEASKKSLKFFSLSNMVKSDKRQRAEERAEHVQRVKEALDLFPEELRGEMWWVQDLRRHYEDRLNSMEEAYKDLESKEWAKLDGTNSKPPKTWKIE
jgi:predicted RND superfamily exporter protein